MFLLKLSPNFQPRNIFDASTDEIARENVLNFLEALSGELLYKDFYIFWSL